MSASVIIYELLDRISGEEGFLWQYDYGQKMRFVGIELPASYTVHFANSSRGASVPSIGDETGVRIPDQVLLSGKPVFFYLFLHNGEDDGQTAYANIINVHPRANMPSIDPPTPEQQSILDELMAALNAGIDHVDNIAENVPQIVDDEIAAAKARGDFKGDPGAVFTPEMHDGVMTWSNDGGLPNPEPTDFNVELGLDNFATKQELSGKVDNGKIGQPNGVAALDETGHVPSELLPSYVDDIIEYPSLSQFPNPGESGKIYISTSNNHQYRWTGSQYIDMTNSDLSTKADKRDTVLETSLSRGRASYGETGTGSIAFGTSAQASGDYSVATGNTVDATGYCSHAEGSYTVASGNKSHAEGTMTYATNDAAHAEGDHATASGRMSHAEGYYTIASGEESHAEGNNAKAQGIHAHAEGNWTNATGADSHAEGNFTKANGNGSHAEGMGGSFTVNQVEYDSSADGKASHIEGYMTKVLSEVDPVYGTVFGGHAEGQNSVSCAEAGHAEGYRTTASSEGAHSEGGTTVASGSFSHAEGFGSSYTTDNNETVTPQAEGFASHVEGAMAYAKGYASHAEGYRTIANEYCAHAEGSITFAGPMSHTEGCGTKALGTYGHAEGYYTNSEYSASHAEGDSTNAVNYCAHAEGLRTTASGSMSHAQGLTTMAKATASHAEGMNGVAVATASHVGGRSPVTDSWINWPEWEPDEYTVGDKVKVTTGSSVQGYICNTANTDLTFDESHWDIDYDYNYIEVIGNGDSQGIVRSNARALDWEGNEYLAGNIYVGCNPDGTGGTKLEPIVYTTLADAQEIINGYGVSA